MEQSSSSTPQSTVLVAATSASVTISAPVASSTLVGTSAPPTPVSLAPQSVRLRFTPANLGNIASAVAGILGPSNSQLSRNPLSSSSEASLENVPPVTSGGIQCVYCIDLLFFFYFFLCLSVEGRVSLCMVQRTFRTDVQVVGLRAPPGKTAGLVQRTFMTDD